MVLRLACVCDLCSILLLKFLHPSVRTTRVIFSLHRLLSFCRLSVVYTSVQILCGICISTYYDQWVRPCDKLFTSSIWHEPPVTFCGCQTSFSLSQEVPFFAKAFLFYPQLNWGFCLAFSAHNKEPSIIQTSN